MNVSDIIAGFISGMLENEGGIAELQRSELAQKFGCVPSQINYVIETRFSPERGYTVESRRGGGGYIRISRVQFDKPGLLMHIVNAVGEEIDPASASAFLGNMLDAGVLSPEESRMVSAALSDKALRLISQDTRSRVRAEILKQCLVALQ